MFYPLFVVFYRRFVTIDWELKTNHLCITDTSVSRGTSRFNFGSLWCAGGRFVRDIYWIAVLCGFMPFHELITFSGTALMKEAHTHTNHASGRKNIQKIKPMKLTSERQFSCFLQRCMTLLMTQITDAFTPILRQQR